MKKLIVLAILMAVMVLVAASRPCPDSRKRPKGRLHQSDARSLRRRVARFHRVLSPRVGGGTLAGARICFSRRDGPTLFTPK